MTTHKNKKLSSFSLDQNNLGPLLPDPQKGAVFTSVTTGSPFRTRNSNLYQAQNEQNDCLHPSSSKAFGIYRDLAPCSAHKWTVPGSMCLHSQSTNIHTREADIRAPLHSFLGGKVVWPKAIFFLFSTFGCELRLIQYLAKWHSVNDMNVKAVIMGRSRRKCFLSRETTGKLPNGY